MNRASTLRRDLLITSGLAVTAYHSVRRSSDKNSAKRKEHFVTFSKISGTNEATHRLTVYESAKKSGPNDKEISSVQITCDNLCGIINDTEHLQLSGKAAVVEACPYLAVVTKTGTLEIRQRDGSHSSTKKHDMWYKSLKQEINFDHSWSVQLESTTPRFLQLSESNKAFLCLTRTSVSVVFAAGYTCILSSPTASCRFKAQTHPNHVLITIKQMSSASETKCTVRANHGIAKTFLRAVGYVEMPIYVTPGVVPEADPLPLEPQPWLLRDTFTELFRGNRPEPDTLKLSLSCVIQLSINLFAAPGQPCWRDLAERLGMSLDDIDMIIRWTCSRYNTPRASGVMLPAMCLLHHWQYVYNKHGVGENPPATPRACNKVQLRSLLSTIGRNDLVNLLDEWETTLTTI